MLGVGSEINNVSVDNITTVGTYTFNPAPGNVTGLPRTGIQASCVLHVTARPNAILWQTLYIGLTPEVWVRAQGVSQGTWESWVRIDNYGSTSLAELASALGDSGKMGVKKYTRTIAANTTIQYSATTWGCSLMLIQVSGDFGTSRYLSKINTGEEILNAGTAKDQKDINYYIESGVLKIQNNTNAEVTLKTVALSFDDLP